MTLTARDKKRLEGVHPDLVSVVRRAFQIWDSLGTGYRLSVAEGVRTKERQAELYAQGRTKPGPIVTWTLESRHITGHAVDIVMSKNGVIPWSDRSLWDALYECMTEAASFLCIDIRSGLDWDMDGQTREKGERDAPHYELPRTSP